MPPSDQFRTSPQSGQADSSLATQGEVTQVGAVEGSLEAVESTETAAHKDEQAASGPQVPPTLVAATEHLSERLTPGDLSLAPPQAPTLLQEESKDPPVSTSKAQKSRSRSPRNPANSEIEAADGSKFTLIKALKKDPEASRYKCQQCKAEMQKKSIESHINSKSHKKHLA
jgi:hypothetical protein